MFSKIKAWLAVAVGFFVAGFGIAIAFLKSISAKKDKKKLERKIEKQAKYTKKKEKIESETNEKLNRLNSDNASSFDSSIKLLHEASKSND